MCFASILGNPHLYFGGGHVKDKYGGRTEEILGGLRNVPIGLEEHFYKDVDKFVESILFGISDCYAVLYPRGNCIR